MAGVLQHLRSSTLDKRPNPASMVDGQVAINYASGAPGMFFKDSNGALVKVGPVHVGSGAPNAVPASGGTAGNSMGEQWLDTSGGTYVFKIWDGSAWRSEAGEFVNVTGDTMTGALGIIAGSAASPSLFISGDANTGLYSPGADQLAISTNGTGRLFIDASGNVKIGSTDNSNAGSQYIAVGSVGVADGGLQLWSRTTGSSYVQFGDTTTAADQYRGYLAYLHFDDALTFGTASTERMRLDSSGRLGLGTSSPSNILEVSSNGTSYIRSTSTTNSISGVIGAATSTFDVGTTSSHAMNFYTAGVNHATLDISGRLGIGTISASERFHVVGGNSRFEGNYVSFNNNGYIRTDATNELRLQAGSSGTIFANSGNSEIGRWDSSGRFLVGTSSYNGNGIAVFQGNTEGSTGPGAIDIRLGTTRPTVADTAIGFLRFMSTSQTSGSYQYANIAAYSDGASTSDGDIPGRLMFSVTADGASSPTERMRIDSSGRVAIGTTTPATLANNGVTIQPNGNTTSVPVVGVGGNSSDNTYTTWNVYSTSLAQTQFYVGYGGTIYARSTSISALSDQREKENIVDLETGLSEIMALQPRRFDWKNGSGQGIAGFIAQEIEGVLPDLIDEYKISETETRKAVKMGDIIPTLVKAIQEQQVVISELQAKVAALEGA